MNQYPNEMQPGAEPPAPAPRAGVPIPLPTSVPTVTYSILGLTIVVFLLQMISRSIYGTSIQAPDVLELAGGRINELIRQGQIWRFITPILLHASVPHILFNMYALYSLGSGLERYFGHGRFLLMYLLCGFSGNVLSFLIMPDRSFSVGASTSIFGLIGAEGVFLYQNRELLGERARRAMGNVAFLIVLNLLIGLAPGIDMYGHIGGLIGGLGFAWFAGPKWQVEGIYPSFKLVDQRETRDVILGAGIVVLVFGALAVWGMTGGHL